MSIDVEVESKDILNRDPNAPCEGMQGNLESEDDDDDEEEEYLTESEARDLVSAFFHDTYRARCSKILSSRFCERGPCVEQAAKMTYDELVAKFRTWSVMEASNDMLVRMLHLINWNRAENPRVSGSVHVKIFLAAYLIASKPATVFDLQPDQPMDSLAQAAFNASMPMIQDFHLSAQSMSKGKLWQDIHNTVGKNLPRTLCRYLKDFKAWKTQVGVCMYVCMYVYEVLRMYVPQGFQGVEDTVWCMYVCMYVCIYV